MNYEALLRKYMVWVFAEEGTMFTGYLPKEFNPEEKRTIRALADSIEAEIRAQKRR